MNNSFRQKLQQNNQEEMLASQQKEMEKLLELSTEVCCEKCNNPTFKQVVLIRKLSALASPNGKEGILPPLTVLACDKCGEVAQKFLSDVLKKV